MFTLGAKQISTVEFVGRRHTNFRKALGFSLALAGPSAALQGGAGGIGYQNNSRNPNRIDRSLLATVLVIWPNPAPRYVPFGLLKCGVLVMLKMSTRTSPLIRLN